MLVEHRQGSRCRGGRGPGPRPLPPPRLPRSGGRPKTALGRRPGGRRRHRPGAERPGGGGTAGAGRRRHGDAGAEPPAVLAGDVVDGARDARPQPEEDGAVPRRATSRRSRRREGPPAIPCRDRCGSTARPGTRSTVSAHRPAPRRRPPRCPARRPPRPACGGPCGRPRRGATRGRAACCSPSTRCFPARSDSSATSRASGGPASTVGAAAAIRSPATSGPKWTADSPALRAPSASCQNSNDGPGGVTSTMASSRVRPATWSTRRPASQNRSTSSAEYPMGTSPSKCQWIGL